MSNFHLKHQREHEWLQKNEHLLGYKRLLVEKVKT
jgi:hypothetical protein